MNHEDSVQIRNVIRRCRRRILQMVHDAGAGHPGGSLSVVDVLAVLYLRHMTLSGEHRDRLVLSKGHAVPALYALFVEKGFIQESLLSSYRQIGSPLEGHPWSVKLPECVDATTGLLGQGVSIGIGMALAKRLRQDSSRAYVIVGDGEMQVGQFWEAALAAGQFRLDNLVCVVDRNRLSSHGLVEDGIGIEPIEGKMAAFGWSVRQVDGHDLGAIDQLLTRLPFDDGKPSFIVANTVKGKGVSFMEHNPDWHSKGLTDSELNKALREVGSD
jgi:transketolase